jgi:hypothetical protein
VNLENGDVVVFVAGEDLGDGEKAPLAVHDAEDFVFFRAFENVVVGDHDTVRGEHPCGRRFAGLPSSGGLGFEGRADGHDAAGTAGVKLFGSKHRGARGRGADVAGLPAQLAVEVLAARGAFAVVREFQQRLFKGSHELLIVDVKGTLGRLLTESRSREQEHGRQEEDSAQHRRQAECAGGVTDSQGEADGHESVHFKGQGP